MRDTKQKDHALAPTKSSRLRQAWRALTGDVPAKPVAPKRGYRKELPARRHCESFELEHEGYRWTAQIGRYPDGQVGEVFLTSTKTGSKIEVLVQDTCVAASIALQYGAPVTVVAKSLARDSRGVPQGPVGIILDQICAEAKPT